MLTQFFFFPRREATITLLLDEGAVVDVWSNDLRGPLDLMQAKIGKAQKGHSTKLSRV